MADSCKTCRFWKIHEGYTEPILGYCQRNAPMAGMAGTGANQIAIWPLTEETAWCGEFKQTGAPAQAQVKAKRK